jgi:uncharacterized protein YceH (UPF0502 family)
MTDDLQLGTIDIRVLAVLAEKERLTPDSYPLSLNALANGCNQLTSRDPVMSVSEAELQQSLETLVAARLVAELSQAGARVPKYEHRMRLRWTLEQDKLAALVMLMLRGPQTAAEVRSRAGRIHEFASVADAEVALQFLIDKFPPLAIRLARSPGTKETRYAHLLSGEPAAESGTTPTPTPATSARQDRVASLEEEVTALKAQVEQLSQEFAEIRRLLD